MTNLTINSRYRIDSFITRGAFGMILKGTDLVTGNWVAIKIESHAAQNPQLAYEYKLYNYFHLTNKHNEPIGIPKVHWFGSEYDCYCLVMDLLGLSLEDLFNVVGRKFSLKTVLMLADQMIERIQYVHSRFYVYRDIKPDNFVLGAPLNSKLNIITNNNTTTLQDDTIQPQQQQQQLVTDIHNQSGHNNSDVVNASSTSYIPTNNTTRDTTTTPAAHSTTSTSADTTQLTPLQSSTSSLSSSSSLPQHHHHLIHLLDFGLSKRYRDPVSKQHAPYAQDRPETGTPRYQSKHAHRRIEQSRRDDLESLGYVFVYFLKGRLPWQSQSQRQNHNNKDTGNTNNNNTTTGVLYDHNNTNIPLKQPPTPEEMAQYENMNKKNNNNNAMAGPTIATTAAAIASRQCTIHSIKENTSIDILCHELPLEFKVYFEYISTLQYTDKPDYTFLRTIFRNLMTKLNFTYDNIFDWTPILNLAPIHSSYTTTSLHPQQQQQQQQQQQLYNVSPAAAIVDNTSIPISINNINELHNLINAPIPEDRGSGASYIAQTSPDWTPSLDKE